MILGVARLGLGICLLNLAGTVAFAQNFSSSGQSWSGSWNFSSATDRSIALQQAQVLRQVEKATPQPETVYNNYYDNRSNYVEAHSQDGAITVDNQVGDEIGENTYSVGSLNTGNTTIAVDGDGNVIDSVNSADTQGCVDGSINTMPLSTAEPSAYLPVVRSCE
jgi:hypothetical protein